MTLYDILDKVLCKIRWWWHIQDQEGKSAFKQGLVLLALLVLLLFAGAR